MSVLASDWIAAAYNRSSENDPGKLAQDPEMLVHLNRVYQRLWTLLARARPDLMGSATTITASGGPATLTIPADTIDLISLFNSSSLPVNIIPVHDQVRTWHIAPVMWRIGNSLVSRNQAGDPINGDPISVVLLDAPIALTSLATPIDARFPIRHHQVPIDTLALYLSTKDAGRDPGDRAALLTELKAESLAFAAEYNLPPDSVQWVHGAVERQGASG